MKDQEILKSIGQALWSIFRDDADKAVFLSKSFLDTSSGEISVQFFRGSEFLRDRASDQTPYDLWNQMRYLTKELQKIQPFNQYPFTHMRYELTDQGKMNVNFAYIPEWDSWPGLFMRGVSELTEAEILPPYPLGIYGIDLEKLNQQRVRFSKEPYQK